ncbi:MAG TPA: YfhO family protein, partial [Bacilli bacterium]|nr:YfhO family protein [Bacilli bacterium]
MKFNKRDYINLLLLNIIFILIVFIILKGKYLYISKMDYLYQYINISEYFRNLFYSTKDIFPDFAFNISSGINIYYLSYYGFLSPYILFSYLLPFLSMQDYLVFSSILMTIASTNLFYKFLRNNNISQNISFITSFLFLFAVPIIFHSKRHIMFVNYMPFLILSLIYIDKYFKTKRISPIIICTALIIFSSYIYSVPSIVVIVIYFIYKYTLNNKINIKKFLTMFIKISIPISIAILLSSILILPTFNTLLSSREGINVNIINLFIPTINLKCFLYDGYGMGLSSISLIALIYGIYYKKTRFLSCVLILLITIPIFSYILNGTLYVSSKPLIPFIPLALYLTAVFLSNIFNSKLNKNVIKIIIILLMVEAVVMNLRYNYKDNLLTEKIIDKKTPNLLEMQKDTGVYRTDVIYSELQNINKVYNNHNITTIYSSVEHPDYLEFYYNKFNNAMTHRNFRIIYANNNYLFQSYMGVKYVVTNKLLGQGYTLVNQYKNLKLYKINNYRSIAYINNNYMSKNEYSNLQYPYNVEALLKYTVLDENINSNYKTKIKEISLDNIDLKKFNSKYKDSVYTLKFNKTTKVEYKTNMNLDNKLLFIRFNMLESNP